MINPKDFLPDLEKDLSTDAITDSVEIYRDKWGIPHIVAKNEHDLFFAQGFSIAQDRLFQMDLDRLRCLGRSSEYLGKKAIYDDKLNVKRDFERVAKSDLNKASNSAKEMISSFTKGVNFYITSTEVFPMEYKLMEKKPELWEDWHSIFLNFRF